MNASIEEQEGLLADCHSKHQATFLKEGSLCKARRQHVEPDAYLFSVNSTVYSQRVPVKSDMVLGCR